MERRKEELEKKRQKLAELRRAREERQHAMQQQDKAPPAAGGGKSRKEVDDLVNTLLKDEKVRPATPMSASANDSDHGSDKGSRIGVSTASVGVGGSAVAPASPTTALPQSPQLAGPTGRYIPDFTSIEAVLLDIAPKEVVYYSKEVQTTENSFAPAPPDETELRAKIEAEYEEHRKQEELAKEEERRRQEEIKRKEQETKALSDGERKQILASAEFGEFVTYSTKIIERALNENYNILVDYTDADDAEGDEDKGSRVKYVCSFYDDRWSKYRSVTDLNWSHKTPELSIAAYNKNPNAMNEPDGVVLVWNLHRVASPEFVFHSQSDVLTTMISPFNPNMIIGGTYSGQILLWDTRAKSLPVLKTPLSAAGHTHPVYSMQIVGTKNAHNLITASTDGLVCSWQLDMLAQPQETNELVHPAHNKTDEVSVTALGFPDNETTAFWVGTEEGMVYQANRYDRAGSKAGINQYDAYRGHWGPVTGLQFHPLFGPVDFSDLFLTASVDWTIKLWKAKSISKPSTAPQNINPLYSFEGSDDYVYDVKWSPSHPALFASVDGTGKFAIWNLNADTEVPVVSTEVGRTDTEKGKALNKIEWDKEGRKAAIGSSDGHVHIYDIGDMSVPRPDEWNILQKTVADMIANSENESGRYGAIPAK